MRKTLLLAMTVIPTEFDVPSLRGAELSLLLISHDEAIHAIDHAHSRHSAALKLYNGFTVVTISAVSPICPMISAIGL